MDRRTFLKGLGGIAAGILAGGCIAPTPRPKTKARKRTQQRPKTSRRKPLQHKRETWYCENDHEFLYGQAQFDLHRALHPTHVIVRVGG